MSPSSGIEITELVGVDSAGITTEASSPMTSFSATGTRDEGAEATQDAEPWRGKGFTGKPFDPPVKRWRVMVWRRDGLPVPPVVGLPTGERWFVSLRLVDVRPPIGCCILIAVPELAIETFRRYFV